MPDSIVFMPGPAGAVKVKVIDLGDGTAGLCAVIQNPSGGGGGGEGYEQAVIVGDGDSAALGATTDPIATSDSGAATLISLFKRLLDKQQVTIQLLEQILANQTPPT